jgi:membrane-bound serine protease (ClpP class)
MTNRGLVAAALFALLLQATLPLQAQTAPKIAAPTVLVVDFSGGVDQGMQQLVQDAVDRARSDLTIKAIIMEMNTPGGLLSNAKGIIDLIHSASARGVKVYTFVLPGGWAASAGSYIAMATDKIFMGGSPLEQEHTQSFMLAYMSGLAQSHNRSVAAAALMVTADKAYTADEAVQAGVADAKASSVSDVLSKTGLAEETIEYFEPTIYDRFLSFLSDPTVDGFLMLLGVIAILVDLFHGSVAITVVGAISIALGLFGAQLIGAPIVALVVFAVAGALIILEVKLPHGISMMSGIALAIFGIWLLAGNASGYSPSPFGVAQYALWGVVGAIAFIGSFYLIKLREGMMRRPRAVGTERVVGAVGYLLTDVDPPSYGTANIASEDWTVTADEPMKAGEPVRAVKVDGSIVTVERVIEKGK